MDGGGILHPQRAARSAYETSRIAVTARSRLICVGDTVADRIERLERMRPFLINVVSDCDLWMFLSSTGALTAGRNNEDRSLFPYETDDQLHQHAGMTGPITIVRVMQKGMPTILWRPFDPLNTLAARSMWKTALSNQCGLEERNDALGLIFRYNWRACNAFGWVRTCEIVSTNDRPIRLDILDGVVNLLPANALLGLQRSGSCLINAYTQAELDAQSHLAIYSLTAQITDRAEPAESLHANIAFQVGLQNARHLLSAECAAAFAEGTSIVADHMITGKRSAFLVAAPIHLEPHGSKTWRIVLDAHRTQGQVAWLRRLLSANSQEAIAKQIDAALDHSDQRLSRIIGASDGFQKTGDEIVSTHHASNTLFNDLRGGTFLDRNAIPCADFASSIEARNRVVADRHREWFAALPDVLPVGKLMAAVTEIGDAQLTRLAMEYLPLTFGRRHGDPSRPWNRFDIRVINEAGEPVLNYQGNWRDIFQNWEALAIGASAFLTSMIAKFVNATTVDGFNPYRVTKQGIEWEVPDPHDPWAHIGYWGDHQIIYLLKLLEALRKTHPESLTSLLVERRFAYANVPYRLRGYDAMQADPHETIDFDWPRHREIESLVSSLGTDGRLVHDEHGNVLLVTLAEKLLVPALSKLSNFVPGGGIWMNTQRPEWNDANNALVGNGVSVVTLCYLRRYLSFCIDLFATSSQAAFPIREDVARWCKQIAAIYAEIPITPDDPSRRRDMMESLGRAFESYHNMAYTAATSEVTTLSSSEIIALLKNALSHVDATIARNRRNDGLYHAYNVLQWKSNTIELEHLQLMLEGQVAVLSSGMLSPAAAAEIVEQMFDGPLWREDQQSFMLYPIHALPSFLEKNIVSEASVGVLPFAQQLLKCGEQSILHRDDAGHVRFNTAFRNVRDLQAALVRLAGDSAWKDGVTANSAQLIALYEQTFRHHGYTGRSGSMYGYEGIGCIYWHMVAKLLLAIQENVFRAADEGASADVQDSLTSLYRRVRAGLGFNKSAEQYGAFPLDAYSHTPLHAGAKQPGMTGQVKEEILTRFGELGVRVEAGCVRFDPVLLDDREFLDEAAEWVLPGSVERTFSLSPDSLGFTFAATPIIYRRVDSRTMWIEVKERGCASRQVMAGALDRETSRRLLNRDESIESVTVYVPQSRFRPVMKDVSGMPDLHGDTN